MNLLFCCLGSESIIIPSGHKSQELMKAKWLPNITAAFIFFDPKEYPDLMGWPHTCGEPILKESSPYSFY